MKIKYLLLTLLLTSCSLSDPLKKESSTNLAPNITSLMESSINYSDLKDGYGNLEVSGQIKDTFNKANYTLENNILTLNTSLGEYTLSGYFNGKIVIPSNVTSVCIILHNAYLENTNSYNIEYQAETKAIEIKSKKDTVNYIVNSSDSYSVYSLNNVKFTGGGTLSFLTNASIIKAKDVTFKYSTINFKTNQNVVECGDAALVYGVDSLTNEIEKAPTLNIINCQSGFICKNYFYGFKGNINSYECSLLFDIGLDLNLSQAGLWDDKNYLAQEVNITKKEATVFSKVLGQSNINESLCKITNN